MKSIHLLITFIIPVLSFGQEPIQDSFNFERIEANIRTGKFETSIKKKDIPNFMKNKLSRVDKVKFRIASGDEEFNAGDALLKRSLPGKRIIYIGFNNGIYIITYEQGGFGRSYYSRIIEYEKKKIKCISTFLMPPHNTIDEFRNIMQKREWIKYVSEKSLCFN